jgi:HAD superfamily hydrolase (TIGR01509 family)
VNVHSATRIELVEAIAGDQDEARLVMEWRNDPVTRAASFHQEEKRWPAFHDEYRGYFVASPLPPLFGLFEGRRVGFIRFRSCDDPEGGAAGAVDISINVAPDMRGRGLGRALIAAASDHALARWPVVVAEIRPGNEASVRAFASAGYRRISDGLHDVDGTQVVVERYLVRHALEALLLDLDGTLIDSEHALRVAFERFLGAHGKVAAEGEYERYCGPPLAEIVAGLAASHQLRGDPGELLRQYERFLEGSYVREAPLASGAEALVSHAARSGLRIGVVTSAPERLTRPLLARLGLLHRVAALVCGDQVARGKPSPEPYRVALGRLGTVAAGVLAVEDTTTGLRAALDAGIRCVGVGPRRAELVAQGAVAGASSLDEVSAVLASQLRLRARVLPARALVVRLVEPGARAWPLEVEQAIDREWDAALGERPHLVDGEILSVLRIHQLLGGELVVEAVRSPYRAFLAQRRGIPLGLRPLGVAGVTVLQSSSDDRRGIVIGRRGAHVTQYPLAWELVPSGGLPPSRLCSDGTVDAKAQIASELTEEVGAVVKGEPIDLALIEDAGDAVVDLCYRLEVRADPDALSRHASANGEYDRIALLPLESPREALRAYDARVPTVEPLLELLARFRG